MIPKVEFHCHIEGGVVFIIQNLVKIGLNNFQIVRKLNLEFLQ